MDVPTAEEFKDVKNKAVTSKTEGEFDITSVSMHSNEILLHFSEDEHYNSKISQASQPTPSENNDINQRQTVPTPPKWTNTDILKFLKHYKKYDILWNSSHEYYPNVQLKQMGYKALLNDVREEGISIDMPILMQKIKIIGDTYRLELNKVNRSRMSGGRRLYKPRLLWFEDAHSFLKQCSDNVNVASSMTRNRTEPMWKVIVEYMELELDFARGKLKCENAKKIYRKKWEELRQLLKSGGYGDREAIKWQKTWSDYKQRVKKHACQLKLAHTSTSGDPMILSPLTALEKRVINIIGVESNDFQEMGLPLQPPTSTNSGVRKRPNAMGAGSEEKKQKIYKKQDRISEMHEEHMNKLSEININMTKMNETMGLLFNLLVELKENIL